MDSCEINDIELGNHRSVSVHDSGYKSMFRYDIYEHGKLVGAMGIDKLITDENILDKIVGQYIEDNGRL